MMKLCRIGRKSQRKKHGIEREKKHGRERENSDIYRESYTNMDE